MQYLSAWAHGRCVCPESCEYMHPHMQVKVKERRLIRESNGPKKGTADFRDPSYFSSLDQHALICGKLFL